MLTTVYILNCNNKFYGYTFGCIAPSREYVQETYMSNKSPGSYVVEFTTPEAGFLKRHFEDNGVDSHPKAEGGGTYGLGPKGHNDGLCGVLFNKLLASRQITWELADLKIDNTLLD